ncbi:NAD(P)-dependent oxidoreductase [Brucella oryzae]|uniref:NAD(P)-dependent oxidoreductase n=1 Tax=Brucella oryzae TaxID=335286 RepID=UPI001B842969|nr:NAD(P)-dependent oxidoreductase [Brucella oryzae]MBR7654140.1 NAD(P)-dependent oxidoreductase [Brucella oryzae]
MTRKIAFLGTGLMGVPMASRLLDAGFDVAAWNRNSVKSASLAEKGAKLAQSATEAVATADVIIMMLTDGPAVRDVLFNQGVAAALKKSSTVIDMSSTSPDFAREHAKRLEAKGINHIDAPVSGGVVGAHEGTLAIMAGGDEAIISGLADVFKPMGRLTRVGPSGAGQLAKLANQQIVAVTIGAIAEAMVLVEKGGGSRAAFRDAIRGGFCESRILELHGKRMIDRNFEPGGTSRIQLKDLNSILKTADDLSLSLPLTETVREAFAAFVEEGGGEKDHSALLLHLEKLNESHRG